MTDSRRAGHRGLVVGVVVGRVRRVRAVEGGRHETQDEVQGDGAEDGDAVDVAIEDLAG